MTIQIDGRDGLLARVGEELGVSEWYELPQPPVTEFAELTGDDNWLHIDVERAKAELGGTIVHGLFTLGLGPRFSYELFAVGGFSQELNYGYQKVRFPAPLPVGSRIRMRATLKSVEDVGDGELLTTVTQLFERDGGEKPVCVAESLAWYIP